jgi:hypothetical protein
LLFPTALISQHFVKNTQGKGNSIQEVQLF